MSDSRDTRPVTDSPWFWVMIFCAFGATLLAVMTPWYAQRQRRLEMQFRAQEEIARRQVEGEPVAAADDAESVVAPPAVGELIIPLWPLVLVFGASFVGSAVMLYRSRLPSQENA